MSHHYQHSASSASQQAAYYAQASSGQYSQYAQQGAATQGYAQQQYAQHPQYAQYHAAQTSSSGKKSSKDKKSSSSRKQEATLFEVEKQWAAAYEHQQNTQARMYGYDQSSIASQTQRCPEPNFTAFTLAGGKSYLEDGSPSPMSSAGRSSGSGSGY